MYLLPLLLISLSFFWRVSSEGGFSPLFSFFALPCQNVFLSPLVGPDIPLVGPDIPLVGPDIPLVGPDIPLVGPDIPCTVGKDGGFIRRDRSFRPPRIDLARAGRCVTDTLSKKLMSVSTA